MAESVHIPVDLARWSAEFDLQGVGSLLIRALTPEDRELERRFLEALSPETLRMRVLGTVKGLTEEQLERLVHFDWSRELALGAIRPAADDFGLPAFAGATGGDVDELIAVARFAPAGRPGVAEFAIVVDDRYQGRGLGEELIRRLRCAAAALGYKTIEGQTLATNERMLALAARLGFSAGADPEDSTLQRISCPTQALRRRAPPPRTGTPVFR